MSSHRLELNIISVKRFLRASGRCYLDIQLIIVQMSAEAIAALKERTGSSQLAIAKWIEGKYAGVLPANFKKQLSLQLKKLSQKGKLVQIKHSYKLSDELKKPAKAVKKVTEKNPAVKEEKKKVVAKTAKSPKKVVKKSVVRSVSTPKKAVKPKTVRKNSGGAVKKAGKESKSAETKKAAEKEVKTKSVKKPAAATGTKKKSASAPKMPAAVKAKTPTSKKAKPTSS
jgi:histone H1/5